MNSAQQNRGLHGTGFSRVLKRAARKLVDSLGQERLPKIQRVEATFSLKHQGAPPGKRSPQMGWTQRQARPAEPPTSRSEALASCTSHRGIGSIAASRLTTVGGRRA